jgi:hypothetical protein
VSTTIETNEIEFFSDHINIVSNSKETYSTRVDVKKNEWLTNGHIDAYQELIHNKFKLSGFCGFFHPIRFETL